MVAQNNNEDPWRWKKGLDVWSETQSERAAAILVLQEAGWKPIAPGKWFPPNSTDIQDADSNEYDIEQVMEVIEHCVDTIAALPTRYAHQLEPEIALS